MKLIPLLLAIASVATAALNTTQLYRLKTELKTNGSELTGYGSKSQYSDLWMSSYHTGAGLSDVVFTKVENTSSKGYLGPTNLTFNGQQFYNALFDFGNDFPWGLVMGLNTKSYSAWQPVEVNAGVGGTQLAISGFFFNATGLQWTSNLEAPGTPNDEFGGWMVCDWWHGVPQLFFRISYYSTPAPASCADIYLKPVYI